MKKTYKTIVGLIKEKGFVNVIALSMVYQNVNSASTWIYHQPVVPETADKLKKHHD